MFKGTDSAARVSSYAARILKENGISFVGRYLVPPGMWKDITAEEIKGLHDAGLAILLCWEIEANAVRLGAERGAKDGARAKELALSLGVPSGTTIFFACDYHPSESERPLIELYIQAAQAACYPYEAGLYGPADIIDYLGARGTCRKFWQCVAWSSGKVSPYLNVYQYQWQGGPEAKAIAAKVGFDVDVNSCEDMEKAGLWLPPSDHHWYDTAMNWAEENGLMMDGRPNDSITRAELATVLMRYDTMRFL